MRSTEQLTRSALILAVAVLGVATSCSDKETVSPVVDGPASIQGYAETMQQRSQSVSKVRSWRTLGDVLHRPAEAHLDALVIGRITSVRPDAGFVERDQPHNEGTDGVITDFDHPSVLWQTLSVEVEVTESLWTTDGARLQTGDTITLGMTTYPSIALETTQKELRSLGTVLVALSEPNAVFDHNASLRPILDDGELLVTIDVNGRLGLPFKEARDAETLLAGTETLDLARSAIDLAE